MIDIRNCPMCNQDYNEYPALSRQDNKTEICSACGTREAMIDYGNSKLKATPDTMTKDKQLMILKSLNQGLVIDYVWDNYADECLDMAKDYNDSYDDDDYSSDRD